MKKFNKTIEMCKNYDYLLKRFTKILNSRNKAPHTYLEDIEIDINERY